MSISFEEYKKISPGHEEGLRTGWTNLMYDNFHAVGPTCSLKLCYNHVLKKASRKMQVPYWKGKAQCKHSGCVTVTFSISDEPMLNHDVIVKVVVDGECCHFGGKDNDFSEEEGEIKKRFLVGSERRAV